MVFAIPRGKISYIGTTDTEYKGNLDRVVATKADAQYLLAAVSHAFPSIVLQESDIISNWAGLRPLIHEDGKSPSELSRKDEIFESETGLISIAGGKLTGYRKMAERIVDLADKRLEEDFEDSKTNHIFLTDDVLADKKAVSKYIEDLEKVVLNMGLDKYYAWYLTTTYGKQSEVILDKMKSFNDVPEIALARAEIWFGIHYEMVSSLEDFFVRRTGRLYFDIGSISMVRDAVIEDTKTYLKWDEARLKMEVQKLEDLLYDATHFYEKELD